MSLFLCLSTTTASAQSTAPPLASRPAPRGPPWAPRPDGRPEGQSTAPSPSNNTPYTDGRQHSDPERNYWGVAPISQTDWRATKSQGVVPSEQGTTGLPVVHVSRELSWPKRKQTAWCPSQMSEETQKGMISKCSRLFAVLRTTPFETILHLSWPTGFALLCDGLAALPLVGTKPAQGARSVPVWYVCVCVLRGAERLKKKKVLSVLFFSVLVF